MGVKFPEKNVTKMYGSTLSALLGGGGVKFPEKNHYEYVRFNIISIMTGCQISRKKRYVTLEWSQ